MFLNDGETFKDSLIVKIFILLIPVILCLLCTDLEAQQYTAEGYFNLENDPAYTSVRQRQNSGDTLTLQELNFLKEYKARLNSYFDKMPDEEKSNYYKNRSKWIEGPAAKVPVYQQEQDIYAGEKSAYTQYLVSSGVFGFIYGMTAAGIIEPEAEGVTAGLSLLSAGAATLWPVITMKDKRINYNSLKLSIHGKALGYAHGAALDLLIQGDNIDEGKLLLTLAGVSSIALGRVGYKLGVDKPWSQGRVALYSHYGILMPLEGVALVAAFEADDPRIYGAIILASGAAGYLVADRIADRNDFTKGDVIATQTLTALNALVGFGIIADKAESHGELAGSDFLFPAFGALGGSLFGHLWLKDAGFSRQQGRNTALVSSGGSALGLGIASLIAPDRPTLYYVLPYITGMASYSIIVSKYKQDNINAIRNNFNQGKNNWNINIMPYNILINKKISSFSSANPSKRSYYLPAFSASVNF